jgi:hypothetical protein
MYTKHCRGNTAASTSIAKIKNTDHNEVWWRCGRSEAHRLQVGIQNGPTTLENTFGIFWNIYIYICLLYNTTIPPIGILQREM